MVVEWLKIVSSTSCKKLVILDRYLLLHYSDFVSVYNNPLTNRWTLPHKKKQNKKTGRYTSSQNQWLSLFCFLLTVSLKTSPETTRWQKRHFTSPFDYKKKNSILFINSKLKYLINKE